MDILLSDFEFFKRYRADTAICTVASIAIVVNFNILEHHVAHLFTSSKLFTMNGFHLHGMEETFSTGVVIAVAFGAHAADQLVFRQEALVHS